MSSGSRGGGERESSRKIPEKKRGLNKNARSGANADPKLGVPWQFGGGGGGAASDDMFIPEPSSKYMRHGVWRHPFLRKTLKGLRLSRFGACLAMVAAIATLNGILMVLFLEALVGSPLSPLSHLSSRQAMAGHSIFTGADLASPGLNSFRKWSISHLLLPKGGVKIPSATSVNGIRGDRGGGGKHEKGKKGSEKFRAHKKGGGDPDKPTKWNPSDDLFLDGLDKKWVVKPHTHQPGAHILQQKDDFACILLLQDVCYAFLAGKSPMHVPTSGVWFAQDLPKMDRSDEIEDDASANPAKLRSEIRGAKSVFTRDLARIDFSKNVCTLYKPPLPPPKDFGFNSHDLPSFALRMNRTYGTFVGTRQLVDYIEGSRADSKKRYRENPPVDAIPIAIIPRHDSHSHHFGESVGALAEMAKHLVPARLKDGGGGGRRMREAAGEKGEEGGGGDEGEGEGKEFTMFFPTNRVVHSNWTRKMGRLVFGRKAGAVAGQVDGHPFCFRNALFVLNSQHTNRSADLIRILAYRTESAQKGGGGEKGQGEGEGEGAAVSSLADLDAELKEKEQQVETEAHSVGGGEGRGRRGRGGGGGFQITLADEYHEGQAVMVNKKEVADHLGRLVPGLPLREVAFANLTMLQEIAIMKRTVLFVAMYGAVLHNLIFMPRGAFVLALYPYKFYSEEHKRISLRSGLEYRSWENVHYGRSLYVDDCMRNGSYAKHSKLGCWKRRECLVCVRDKSLTDVRMQEVLPILEGLKHPIDQWVKARWRTMTEETRAEAGNEAPNAKGREGGGMGVKGGPVVASDPVIKGSPVIAGNPVSRGDPGVGSNLVKAERVIAIVSENSHEEKGEGVGEVAGSKDGEKGGVRKRGGSVQREQTPKGGNGGAGEKVGPEDKGKGSGKGQSNLKSGWKGEKNRG